MKKTKIIALLLSMTMLMTAFVPGTFAAEVTDSALICGMEEHIHTDICYVEEQMVCGAMEHTHGESCYEVVETIAETKPQFEKSVNETYTMNKGEYVYKDVELTDSYELDMDHEVVITDIFVNNAGDVVYKIKYNPDNFLENILIWWKIRDYIYVKGAYAPVDPDMPVNPPVDPDEPEKPDIPVDPNCLCGAVGETHLKGCPLYVEVIKPLPVFPACDCSGGELAGHDEECEYIKYASEIYLSGVTEKELCVHWEEFDDETKNTLYELMEEEHAYKLYLFEKTQNGELNECATIVDGASIVAVGPIPDGVQMSATKVYEGGILNHIENAAFAYDISFMNEDGEWQPDEGKEVTVTLEAKKIGLGNGDFIEMFHYTGEGEPESIGEYLVAGGKLSFHASAFSEYAGVLSGHSTRVVNDAQNITINLFDYGSLVTQKNDANGGELAVGLSGASENYLDKVPTGIETAQNKGNTLTVENKKNLDANGDGVYDGIDRGVMGMIPVLDSEGYPQRESTDSDDKTISMKYFFDKGLEASTEAPYSAGNTKDGHSNFAVLRYPVNVGSLFAKKDGGYLSFDSKNNHVWYNFQNQSLVVEQNYAVNPNFTNDKRYSAIGHFLPFNGNIIDNDGNSVFDLLKDPNKKNEEGYTSTGLLETVSQKNHYSGRYQVDPRNFYETTAERLYNVKFATTDTAIENKPNMWIGMSVEFDFNQKQNGKINEENMIFEFSGDDLMWVYINDVMILDVSSTGVHNDAVSGNDRNVGTGYGTGRAGGAKKATINFATGDVFVYRVDSSWIDIEHIDTNKDGRLSEDEKKNGESTVQLDAFKNDKGTQISDGTYIVNSYEYHVAYSTTIRQLFEAAFNAGYITENEMPNFKGDTFADFETLNFKMFYMDTGHGTSNCTMKFNMDPLPAGNLSVKKVEDELNDEFCGNTEYRFQLLKKAENDIDFSPVKDAMYNLTGYQVSGESSEFQIGENGIFTLKGGQTAIFTSGITVKDTLKVIEISSNSNAYSTKNTVAGVYSKDQSTTDEIIIQNPDDKHDVEFINTWITSDLTIKKEVIGEVGDKEFEFVLTNSEYSKTWNFKLKKGVTYIINDLPIGYSFNLTEEKPYNDTDPIRYLTPKFNNEEVAFNAAYSLTISKDKDNEITVQNTCVTDLTITKELEAAAMEDQSFLFNVKKQDTGTGMDVIISLKEGADSASAVIKDIIVGTYIVEEDENWAWRYDISTGDTTTKTVNLQNTHNVEFSNSRNRIYWLSGDCYRENWWGGESGTIIDTTVYKDPTVKTAS